MMRTKKRRAPSKYSFVTLGLMLGIVIFSLFRSSVIHRAWSGRASPPEPDDSYVYLMRLSRIVDTGQIRPNAIYIFPSDHYEHLVQLPWRLGLVGIKLLTGLAYEEVYRLNFYFGIIILASVLVYFLSTIESTRFAAMSLPFLSLYNGSGPYHGFFWVVPSFYSVVFFLLLAAMLHDTGLDGRDWKLLGPLSIVTSVWMHQTGILALSVFPVSLAIYFLLDRFVFGEGLPRFVFWRGVYVATLGLISFFVMYSLSKSATGCKIPLTTINLFRFDQRALRIFKREYFSLFCNDARYGLPLLVGVLGLILRRKNKLISLYLGSLLVSTTSLMYPSGHRMLAYLWPVTFVVLSYGIYFAIDVLIEGFRTGKSTLGRIRRKKISLAISLRKKPSLAGTSLFFVVVSGIFFGMVCYPFVREQYDWNIEFSDRIRNRMDYELDPVLISYLRNNTARGDLVLYETVLAYSYVTVNGFTDRKSAYCDWNWTEGQYRNQMIGRPANGTYIVAESGSSPSILENVSASHGSLHLELVGEFSVFRLYKLIYGEG